MEAHLDATLASIINQTVLEQIIDSKSPHLGAPFSSPF